MADEEIVYLIGEGGGRVRPHSLPLPEGIADRLAKGQIRRVNEDGSTWEPPKDAEHDPANGVSAPAEPAKNASKNDWVTYALSVDEDLTEDQAQLLSRDELVAAYGSK